MALEAGQLLAGLALIGVQLLVLWGVIELSFWIYCKAKGRNY